MTRATSYDLSFRPADYFAVPETMLASVKGNARRRMIRDAIEGGKIEALPAALMGDSLPAPLLAILHARCPSLTTGETLPDCDAGEVEIARVNYTDTTLGDVASFRARGAGKRITFRAVTDNGDDVPAARITARLPLTLSGLLQLIERAEQGIGYWRAQLACGVPVAELPRVSASSAFYADLERCYAERAARWLHRQGGGELAAAGRAVVIACRGLR